jgi:hypothetical protein
VKYGKKREKERDRRREKKSVTVRKGEREKG